MRINKTLIIAIIAAVSLSTLSGCTNWKKEHAALTNLYENCMGQKERLKTERGQLAGRLTSAQMSIDELNRQIAEGSKSAGELTDFGKGYDVDVDAARGTITVTLDNEILFIAGKASLKRSTISQLDHIKSVLQQSKYEGKEIDVVGHTDSDPIKKTKKLWKDNWELSAQRALTVTRYLIKKGINDSRIRAVGCGEARPRQSNSTRAGKKANRRVEIVVYMI